MSEDAQCGDETERGQSGGTLNPAGQLVNEEDLVNAMDEEIRGVPETRVPLTVKSPASPTMDEVQTHNLTHNPYQSWCPVCVAAQGKEDAHRRDGNNEDAEGALKTIGIDYGFIGDGQERATTPTKRSS